MRGVVVLALIVTALTPLVASASGSAGGWSASLRVSYWEDGDGPPDAVWMLRCNPTRGTLAKPVQACRKLAAGGARLFAATPPDTPCTELYGGPQRARIVGRVGRAGVWTTITRTNGCEVGRWQRLSPWLLPTGVVT